MSAIQRTARWTFVVEDSNHWTPEHRAELCDERKKIHGHRYHDDFVHARLTEVMERAGREFMAQNPDLFRGELI